MPLLYLISLRLIKCHFYILFHYVSFHATFISYFTTSHSMPLLYLIDTTQVAPFVAPHNPSFTVYCATQPKFQRLLCHTTRVSPFIASLNPSFTVYCATTFLQPRMNQPHSCHQEPAHTIRFVFLHFSPSFDSVVCGTEDLLVDMFPVARQIGPWTCQCPTLCAIPGDFVLRPPSSRLASFKAHICDDYKKTFATARKRNNFYTMPQSAKSQANAFN